MRGCLLKCLVRRVRAPQTCSLCSAAGPAEEVIVALGSNQGDRVALLRAAVRALPQVGVHVRAFSSLYETAPAYVTEQARGGWKAHALASTRTRARRSQSPFLNAALSCTTTLEPLALLAALKRVEAQLGRTAGGQVCPLPSLRARLRPSLTRYVSVSGRAPSTSTSSRTARDA